MNTLTTNLQAALTLTVDERAALLECEAVIREGREQFVHVGRALARVRDSRLYREEYATFEEYCASEWDMTARFALYVRSAAEVVGLLADKDFAVLPSTESQARELAKLRREEWGPAWEEVLGTAPGGKVTAEHVRDVVRRRKPRTVSSGEGREPGAESGTSSKIQNPKSKVVDVGPRDEQIKVTREQIEGKLRELRDLIGAKSDGMPVSYVTQAQWQMDLLREHLDRVGVRKESVQRSNGLRPDNAKRALDARMGAAL